MNAYVIIHIKWDENARLQEERNHRETRKRFDAKDLKFFLFHKWKVAWTKLL